MSAPAAERAADGVRTLIERLEGRIRGYGERALVAFSGGVDSSVVLALAARALGPGEVEAVTAISPSYPAGELRVAVETASELGVAHRSVETHEVEREAYARNDELRCYHCKAELYAVLGQIARSAVPDTAVLAGANADDLDEFRPGIWAGERAGIRNPLLDASVGKATFGRSLGSSGSASPTSPRSHVCPRAWSSGSASRQSFWLGSMRPKGSCARSGSTWSAFATAAGSRRSRFLPPRSIGSSSIPRSAACSARSQRSAGTTCGSTRRAIGLAARSRAEDDPSRSMSFGKLTRLTQRCLCTNGRRRPLSGRRRRRSRSRGAGVPGREAPCWS